jgi:hypothetical protein
MQYYNINNVHFILKLKIINRQTCDENWMSPLFVENEYLIREPPTQGKGSEKTYWINISWPLKMYGSSLLFFKKEVIPASRFRKNSSADAVFVDEVEVEVTEVS